jgi:hypothetical protein
MTYPSSSLSRPDHLTHPNSDNFAVFLPPLVSSSSCPVRLYGPMSAEHSAPSPQIMMFSLRQSGTGEQSRPSRPPREWRAHITTYWLYSAGQLQSYLQGRTCLCVLDGMDTASSLLEVGAIDIARCPFVWTLHMAVQFVTRPMQHHIHASGVLR